MKLVHAAVAQTNGFVAVLSMDDPVNQALHWRLFMAAAWQSTATAEMDIVLRERADAPSQTAAGEPVP